MDEKRLKLLKAKKEAKQKLRETKALKSQQVSEERQKDREQRQNESEAILSRLDTLNDLIGTQDYDRLVQELSKLDSLREGIEEINQSIKNQKFELPDKTKITNLKELTDYFKLPDIKFPEVIDKEWQKEISDKLKALEKGVQIKIVNRDTDEFVPFRRVIKMGNKLVFDDARMGGSGSAGPGPVSFQGSGGVVDVSASNPLPVDATLDASDIEIGAVEIKDGSTDQRASVNTSGQLAVNAGDPTYYQGTVSAAAVNVVGLIDGSEIAVLELQHRGTQGQFKFTLLVEGTDDSTATGDEAAGAASTAKGWTSLEVRSASGAEMSSIVLGGRYLLYNPPRKIRIRCSSYTFGSADIFVMAKPVSQQDPSRIISDKDALASLALTTFGQAQVTQRTFLAGSNFDDASLDTDVWTNLNANGGSHAFGNGVIELHSGTSSNGLGGVRSINLADVLGAADNAITIRTAVGSVTDGQYAYRFGVYSATEGTFIQLAGNARTITDAVFNATTTMTSATAAFTAADLGKRVTSSGNVTAGTTIVQINSATSVTLSAAALATASGQTVDIEGFGVAYVNRKAGVDTTSTFGIIGFSQPTITANAQQLWEITFNPNFLIVRNSGNFAQLQIGSTVLSPMFSEYDLPLAAEAINIGSTSDHVLYLQTLTAERLGLPSSIRANETFRADDVLQATATITHGQQPDGDFVGFKADGLAKDRDGVNIETSTPLAAAGVYQSGWMDSDGWASVELSIAADQVSGTNGILIEFTDDVGAGTPTVKTTRTYTFSAADVAEGDQTYRFNTELDGFRIKYTNGGTPQGSFYLAVNMRTQATSPQGGVEGSFGASNTTLMTRGVVTAKNDAGTYDNIKRGTSGGLRVSVNQHEVETPIKALPGFKVTRTSMTAVAAPIVSAPLANRRSLSIRAICSGSAIIYIGHNSSVTASTGYPLADGQAIDLDLDDTFTTIYGITSSGTQAVSVAEVASA